MTVPPPKLIVCRSCHKDTGYTEQSIMHRVIPKDGLQCKHCGHIFLKPRQVAL